MKRFYVHCPDCHTRMTKVDEDPGKERIFYLCARGCGKRITYLRDIGGISEDWPRQVFGEAVRSRILTTKGEVVRKR